jgi:hypothetical protein
MRRFIGLALFFIGTATAEMQIIRNVMVATPPPALPEFLAIALLLGTKQGATVGSAVTNDSHGPSLLHFQSFKEADNALLNSVEMHADGTIYVAYTRSLSPIWYDTYEASDEEHARNNYIRAGAGGTRKFSELENGNVNEGNWVRNTDAFPPGRGPAPRWFEISIPVRSGGPDQPPVPLFRPDGWLNFLRSGPVEQINKLIPHESPTLPSSGDYCYRDLREIAST